MTATTSDTADTSAAGRPAFQWYVVQGALVRVGVFAIVAMVLALLGYPIGRMVYKALAPDGSLDLSAFGKVAQAEWFWPTMRDTVLVVFIAAAVSLAIAAMLAWIQERTDAGLGWLGKIMPLMPLLMPPIAMAAGWYVLAAPEVGFLNGFLAPLTGSKTTIDILTYPGVVFVYVLALVPHAYIPISGALQNVDPALEEASRVSGARLPKTIFRISLPCVSQALMSAFFLLVVTGFALYSVPVVIGTNANVQILSVRIIRLMNQVYPADLESATVLTTVLLMFILSSFALQELVTRRGRYAMISGRSGQNKIRLGRAKQPLRALLVAYLVITTVLPVGALLLVAVQPFWNTTIDPATFTAKNFITIFTRSNSLVALQTSVSVGLVGGLVSVAICLLVAIAKRRASFGSILSSRVSPFVDSVMRLPAAFSHIVIGMGFIIAFSGPPFNLGGTATILGLCYVVAYMPNASTTVGNALSQIGNDLTEASYMSQAGDLRTNGRIVLPLALPGLFSSWALVFVLFATEISASTMLAGAKTPVIGFVLVDYWNNGTVSMVAAFALVVTLITSSTVLGIQLLGQQRFRRVK
jgi:iron(III) transport system permease protein